MSWSLQFLRREPDHRSRIEAAEQGSLSIQGDVDGGDALFLEAHVVGDITAGRISIGPAGVIHGSIRGGTVKVAGKVHGAIFASEVYLDAGAAVFGTIEHLSLTIAENAEFEGQSVRRASEEAPAPEAGDDPDLAVTDATDEVDAQTRLMAG